VLRVTHVESENIGAFVHQLPQRFRFLARRAERANYFGFAHGNNFRLKKRANDGSHGLQREAQGCCS